GRKDLVSVEDRLTFTRNRWTSSLQVWSGSQAFAVRDGGFVVFNLAEEHTGGAGATLRYALRPDWSVAAQASLERFRELGRTTRSEADGLSLVVGHTF
ncbi:MAG: hypothetical protein HY814_03905, partial [Candidatus Riflebacteria bacterium]|nr:hypothetical protein [Candidatus Riflebacteria bacterium]